MKCRLSLITVSLGFLWGYLAGIRWCWRTIYATPTASLHGTGWEGMWCQTLSKCLLPSCVQLQKDTCEEARALDLSLKTSSAPGGMAGVERLLCIYPWFALVNHPQVDPDFCWRYLGPCSPTICLLYPSLVVYLDTICCSMCAVGKRAAGGRLFLDRAPREQPRDRLARSQHWQLPSWSESVVLWLGPCMYRGGNG